MFSNSFGSAEAPLGRDRIGESRLVPLRFFAEAAGGELVVLLADGGGDVARCQVVLGELVRTEPDAHGIVGGAEQDRVTDAGRAAQLVDDVDQRVVGHEDRVVTPARRRHRDHLRIEEDRFCTCTPSRCTSCGNSGSARCTRLLTLMVAWSGIGADREGHGDRQRARAGRGRAHVEHLLDAVDLLLERRGHGGGDALAPTRRDRWR